MKTLASLCGAATIACMMTGCGSTPANTHDADVKAIGNIEAQWNQDWESKDADKILSHYADDAVLMVPGMAAVTGKDAIRASMQQMLADPALSLKFRASNTDVSKSGDLGYTQGIYEMTITDSATHKVINDHGSYVTTYRKKTDGSWKAEADIATSSIPPAAPAPGAKSHHGKRAPAHASHSKKARHGRRA